MDLRESPGATRPLYGARNLRVALDFEQLEGSADVHRALPPFLPCLYRLTARGHWLEEQRPIRRERKPGPTPDWPPTSAPDVTADDFVLSSVLSGELYMHLKLTPHGISFGLGPYPHIREFANMLAAHLAPGRCWRGRYFKPGKEAGGERISGESAFQFQDVRVWSTSKERIAIENVPMQSPELQTTLAETRIRVW